MRNLSFLTETSLASSSFTRHSSGHKEANCENYFFMPFLFFLLAVAAFARQPARNNSGRTFYRGRVARQSVGAVIAADFKLNGKLDMAVGQRRNGRLRGSSKERRRHFSATAAISSRGMGGISVLVAVFGVSVRIALSAQGGSP